MNPVQLLANLLFSETKDPEDAQAIANVILNRLKKPQRFGATLEDVIFAPYQFSGVGSNEWNKAVNQKFTDDEAKIYKNFLVIASKALKGQLEDNTNGADHYANLKLSKPSWAKIYPKTAQIGSHTYFKEVIPQVKKVSRKK